MTRERGRGGSLGEGKGRRESRREGRLDGRESRRINRCGGKVETLHTASDFYLRFWLTCSKDD